MRKLPRHSRPQRSRDGAAVFFGRQLHLHGQYGQNDRRFRRKSRSSIETAQGTHDVSVFGQGPYIYIGSLIWYIIEGANPFHEQLRRSSCIHAHSRLPHLFIYLFIGIAFLGGMV